MTRFTRSNPRTDSPRWLAVVVVLLAAFVLAACAQSAGVAPEPPGRDEGGIPVDLGGNPGPDGFTDGSSNGGGQVPDISGRKIVKTGEVTIEVADVAVGLGKVRALAVELGGYVGGSFLGSQEEYATLTLRIPADRFDDALARLRAFDGEVLTESTSEQDVTSAVVDLDARLRNLEASEKQYLTLLERTGTVEEILAVQIRLDDVRGQIEQLKAQLKDLNEMADLATLTVSLVPTALHQATGEWDPGKTISDAIAALVAAAQGLANGAIWFGIVWLPGLLLLLIVIGLGMRFIPGLRSIRMPRRRPNPPAEPKS